MIPEEPKPAEVKEFLEDLTFTDDVVDAGELPPTDAPVKVVRSMRLPFEIDLELKVAAEARGLKPGELARELVESGLAQLRSEDRQVSLADVMRTIARMRPSSAA
jgi:hypothetical protein